MRDQGIKTKNAIPTNRRSWTWNKVWVNTLFRPSVATGEALLSEGNLSLHQAILWLVVASLIESSLIRFIFLVQSHVVISWQIALKEIGNILLSSLAFPLGIFIFCGVIHIVAKLFGSKGTLRDFFLVSAAFTAPLLILFGISFYLGFGIYKITAFTLLASLIEFYWLIVINTIVIRSVYHFSWPRTCSIIILITIGVFSLVLVLLYLFFKAQPR